MASVDERNREGTLPSVVLDTTRFGELAIDPDTVISIADGIPGFADFTEFVLLEVAPDEPLYWLQSIEDGELAFLSCVPWTYYPDYELELGDDDEAALDVEDASDLLVLSLLTVDRENAVVTANLLGPIVINQRARIARQIVMVGDHPVQALFGPAPDQAD